MPFPMIEEPKRELLQGPYHVSRDGDDYYISNGKDFFLMVECLGTSPRIDRQLADWIAARLNAPEGAKHE